MRGGRVRTILGVFSVVMLTSAACKTTQTSDGELKSLAAVAPPPEARVVCSSPEMSLAFERLDQLDRNVWASDGGPYTPVVVGAGNATPDKKRFLASLTNSQGGSEGAFFSMEDQSGVLHAKAYVVAEPINLDLDELKALFLAGNLGNNFELAADLSCQNIGGSDMGGAAPRVNLNCKLPQGSREAQDGGAVDLTVVEQGEANAAQIPAGVPGVFLSDIRDARFSVREFRVTGNAKIKDGSSFYQEAFASRPFFGNLGKPSATTRNAYADYSQFKFPAITIRQGAGGAPRYQLYFNGNGAFDIDLACTGDLPAVEPGPAAPTGLAYGYKFKCDVAARGQIPAIQISFAVAELQADPRMAGQGSNQIRGSGVAQHPISILNTGDLLTARRDGTNLRLHAESAGVVEGRLMLAYPEPNATTTSGKFHYRSGEVGATWANVSCALTPL